MSYKLIAVFLLGIVISIAFKAVVWVALIIGVGFIIYKYIR
jgi:hypothetical protein